MIARLLLALAVISAANGANILFTVPFPSPSHWFFLQNFVKELVNRGHSVTAVVPKKIDNFNSTKYTEILIDPAWDMESTYPMTDIYDVTGLSDYQRVELFEKVGTPSSEHGLRDPKVQQLINSTDLSFDLVINEDFYHDSWLMFGYKFNAPTVTICPFGHTDYMDYAMGLMTPWSFVPHHLLTFDDRMDLSQRLHNFAVSLYDVYFRHATVLPRQDEIAQRHFGHLVADGETLPTVKELYHNVSLMLVNSHRTLSAPRPMMPTIVQIGGSHVQPPKKLPADLELYLNQSTDGVIVFSMGSLIQGSKMPQKQRDAFLTAFGRLKQNVLWKFEDDSMTNVPPNVRIMKWLPQSDVIAHPNVVLFITHGGMSSTIEGIARGVPLLFIPVFCDQERNAHKAAQAGNGRVLRFQDVTAQALSMEISAIVGNAAYTAKAKEAGRLFNDNLVHPMDEAMYWIEYVINSNGAKHLKSHAGDLWWFQYIGLDILIIYIITFVGMYVYGKKAIMYVYKKVNKDEAANKGGEGKKPEQANAEAKVSKEEKAKIAQVVAQKQKKKYPEWYKYCGLSLVFDVVAWCDRLLTRLQKIVGQVFRMVIKAKKAPQSVKQKTK